MTCILSLLTDKYVMQVSDRRLTKAGRAFNEPLRIVDDHANKAVFLDGRFAFSYTGLAWFRGSASEEWLAKLWANDEADPNNAGKRFERCASRLTAEFRHVGWADAIKRLAYIGVGWVGDGSVTIRPALIVVTNYHGAEDWLGAAEDQFKVLHKLKPQTSSFYLHQAGVGIPEGNWRQINRDIRRLVDHNASPSIVAATLVKFIQIAADNRKTVGHRCMITCIPISTISARREDRTMYYNDVPNLSCRTFFYVDGPYVKWPQVGPILATPGWCLSEFESSGPGGGILFGNREVANS